MIVEMLTIIINDGAPIAASRIRNHCFRGCKGQAKRKPSLSFQQLLPEYDLNDYSSQVVTYELYAKEETKALKEAVK